MAEEDRHCGVKSKRDPLPAKVDEHGILCQEIPMSLARPDSAHPATQASIEASSMDHRQGGFHFQDGKHREEDSHKEDSHTRPFQTLAEGQLGEGSAVNTFAHGTWQVALE